MRQSRGRITLLGTEAESDVFSICPGHLDEIAPASAALAQTTAGLLLRLRFWL